MKLTIYLVIFCYTQLIPVESWRSFRIRLSAIKCVPHSYYAEYLNCTLSQINKYLEGINMNIKFGDVIQKPKLMLTVYSLKNNQPDFIIVNVTNIDGCRFLDGNGGLLNILQIIRNQFLKHSNIPKKCPVAKHTEIGVKDLYIEADNFPPYMPEAKYNVEVQLWEQTTPVFELLLNGSVEYKSRRSFQLQ